MYLRKVGCEGGDSVHLTQDRVQWRAVVNAMLIMILRAPQKAGNLSSSLTTLSFSWRTLLRAVC
jgi:hypothetical protein